MYIYTYVGLPLFVLGIHIRYTYIRHTYKVYIHVCMPHIRYTYMYACLTCMYTLYVCLMCMPYMYALYVSFLCAPYMYVSHVCMYALYICLICMPHMHALYVSLICLFCLLLQASDQHGAHALLIVGYDDDQVRHTYKAYI